MLRIAFVVVASCVAILPAQEPRALALPDLVPIHTAPTDPDGGPYGIWAAGRAFKASFHDGFVFHALVGAPGDEPARVAFRLLGTSRGEQPLSPAAQRPAPRWTATRCQYDHGTVVEAYDVRAEGIEQTFVFREPPSGSGDLRIVGEFDCGDLSIRRTAAAADGRAGLQFADASGAVRLDYGAAIAFDATGDSCPVRTEVDGRRVVLTVDAGWLANARWPVLVDPLLRPNTALGVTQRVVGVDVFRDDEEEADNLWVAMRIENGGDTDLLLRRLDDTFAGGPQVFADITTSWKIDGARLAGIGGVSKVVTFFTRDFGSSRGARWHLHGKADAALRTNVGSVPRPSGTHDWQVDVGGSRAFVIGRRALLVWQRDTAPTFADTSSSRVHGALLDASLGTDGTLGSAFRLDARDTLDQEDPSVNAEAEGGAAFSWVVAWRGRDTANPFRPFRVAARRVDNTSLVGNRYDAPLGLIVESQGAPQIAGSGGRYLLAYGTNPRTQGFGELLAVRLDWPHGAADAVQRGNAISLEAGFTVDAQIDGVAFDTTTRSHWAVVRRDVQQNTLRVTRTGSSGRVVEHQFVALSPGFDVTSSAVAFDDDAQRFPIAAGLSHPTASQAGQVLFDALVHDALQQPTEYGTGCTSGRVRWLGSQFVGDEFPVLDVVGAAPARLSMFALALLPAATSLQPFGMPGCTLLVDATGAASLGVVTGFTDAGGRLALPMPLPEHLPPLVLHAQAFQFDPAANAAGIVATRALAIAVGR